MRMRSRAGQVVLASIAVVAAGCGGATTHTSDKGDRATGDRDRAGGHEAKVEVRDPDQGGKPGRNPNQEAFQDRALPRGYITAENVRSAARLRRPPPAARRQRLPARHHDAAGP